MPRTPIQFLLLLSVWVGTAVGTVAGQQPADFDEQQLQALGLKTDTSSLLDFFRQRTPQPDDARLLRILATQVNHEQFAVRSRASQQLLARGAVALPYLRLAQRGAIPFLGVSVVGLLAAPQGEVPFLAANGLVSGGQFPGSSLEAMRRIEECIRQIEQGTNSDAPSLAARVLAQRGAAGAVPVLLDFLPAAADPWLEEEVLTALGRLAVRPGRVDPELLQALADPRAGRRAAAAFVLGRRGELGQRERLRRLLEDADPLVRQRTAEGLVGKQAADMLRDAAPADEALLRQHGVEPMEPALLEFLHKRTLDAKDQDRLRQLVRQLASPRYADRSSASRLLIAEGTPAFAFLRPAEDDSDVEVVRRAQHCIDMIRRGPGSALPTAAVHLLARLQSAGHSPAAAVQSLLAYIPFADDEGVEEAVLTSLTLLSMRQTALDPALTLALSDPFSARRAAAAYVLGHVGTRVHQAALRHLLDDPAPSVRLRAVQGLLAAHDREAVPRLIALLGELPQASLWRAEEVLYRLAGEGAPVDAWASETPAARQKAVLAWEDWWQKSAAGVDLGRLSEQEAYLGMVSVAEYDSALGRPGGRVWEGGRDGRQRWQLTGLIGAMDAQVLPNGRVLVAENSAFRVTERDLQGKVRWEYRLQGNPISCQRLPNGNTFIALYNQVLEVTPDQKVVYRHMPGPQFYIFSAHKTRNGRIVAMTAMGQVLELDAMTGKQLHAFNGGANGNWCGIESLSNGNFLIATLSNNQVREVTREGKIVWSANYAGVFRATRLPNGNTLVASMTTRKIAELDRSGTPRWERTCEGRPWSVHYR
jgi:HEAT repeat protein